jgi:phytoene dehydrogenase-like protein
MITPPRSQDNLAVAAAYLKRAAPKSWAEFMTALEAINTEAATLCVQAPPDQILVKQGRAQQLVELVTSLRDCIATADKLEAKLKGAK